MALDSFRREGRLSSPAWDHPKRSELPLFFAGIQRAIRRWKALNLGSLNMQFQQDWPKDKKLQLF